MGKVVDAELEVLEAGGEVFDDVELVCYEPWARSTWPLSWGLFGGRTKRRRLRSRQAPSNSALNSDPPSTWIPSMRKGASARSLSRRALAQSAVARPATGRGSTSPPDHKR